MTQKNTDYKLQLLAADPRCSYCDKELKPRTSTLDHVVPKSRGGTNGRHNLVLTCKFCNMAKAARLPEELLTWASRIVAAAQGI